MKCVVNIAEKGDKTMSGDGRIVGGGCGSILNPEVTETKKEKGCCHGGCVQCNRETGCGLGPAQEGSVKDASGLLQSEISEGSGVGEYLITFSSGNRYVIDLAKNKMTYQDFYTAWRRGLMIEVRTYREAGSKDIDNKYIFNLSFLESITRY